MQRFLQTLFIKESWSQKKNRCLAAPAQPHMTADLLSQRTVLNAGYICRSIRTLFDYITCMQQRGEYCVEIFLALSFASIWGIWQICSYGVVLQSFIEQGSCMDLRSCSHCIRAADEKLFCHLCTNNTLHVSNERQNQESR